MNGTTQSSSLETSSPTPAPRPRLLHWAARLVLIAACAGTVATSKLLSPPVFSEGFVGDKVTLTNEAPRTTRDIIVRVISAEPHSDIVEAEVRTSITTRWIPADPHETALPWLHVSQFEGEESPGMGTTATLLAAGDPLQFEEFTVLNTNCELTGPCEWLAHLRFEMQADGPKGTIEVEWTSLARGAVRGMDEVPSGFTVLISAP